MPCTAPHDAEFVGVYQPPADVTYAQLAEQDGSTSRACLNLVATYAKVPRDGKLRYRAGTIYYFPSEESWADGVRRVQCFLWMEGKKLTRSVRGGGPKALPIR